RLVEKFVDIAQAEVSERVDAIRQAQHLGQFVLVEDADPTYANAFRPCCQPQVLYRQAGAGKIHVDDAGAAQHRAATPIAVTADTEVEGAFENAFELQAAI